MHQPHSETADRDVLGNATYGFRLTASDMLLLSSRFWPMWSKSRQDLGRLPICRLTLSGRLDGCYCYRVLQGATRCYCCRLPPAATGCYCYRLLQGCYGMVRAAIVTGCYGVLHAVTVTGCYRVLHAVTVAQFISPLDIDGIGQNWEDSNTEEKTITWCAV